MIKLATVFSGIGAVEQALEKLNLDYEIVFACDNGERELKYSQEEILNNCKGLSNREINNYVKSLYNNTKKPNHVKDSYFANYDIDEDRWYEDIRFIDGKEFENKIDILVGGSPCQSFSIIGKRAGLEDARGTLFYEFARLIDESKPNVFIYENVLGMLSHDKGRTWKHIYEIFESLGYKLYVEKLNSQNYGIPQDRKRLFVVGFKDETVDFDFPSAQELTTTLFDYLEENVDAKHYVGQKGFEFISNPKNKARARINHEIIQTQKANQQFNWNGDFVFEEFDKIKDRQDILNRAYIGEWNGKKGVIRQLTYRECLRLMGFSDHFKVVVPNVPAYRQIGNSIVVNVLEGIVKQILVALDDKKDMPPLKVATVFSGIGAIEFALKRMNVNHEIVFACDNGDREIEYDVEKEREHVYSLKNIDEKKQYVDDLYSKKTKCKNYVQESYLANYKLDKSRYFQDIILLDGKDFKGQVDLFVGGSPCQSFSSVGSQAGLEDARGTLFYEYARLVKEIQPKVFIYENVRNLINHDGGKTWKQIKEIFDSLGYHYKFEVLNSSDYGIPQTRRRLFVVGFKKDVNFEMPKAKELKYIMKDFTVNRCADGQFKHDAKGDLVVNKIPGEIDPKYTLSPKLYAYVMKGGTKTFYQKPLINLDIARTILQTMGNRHRAGVDNYVSFDGTENLGSVRMLSEREAHRLMGFTDDYKIVVSRAQAYKQAGNSIVVDVLMSILEEIFKTEVFK